MRSRRPPSLFSPNDWLPLGPPCERNFLKTLILSPQWPTITNCYTNQLPSDFQSLPELENLLLCLPNHFSRVNSLGNGEILDGISRDEKDEKLWCSPSLPLSQGRGDGGTELCAWARTPALQILPTPSSPYPVKSLLWLRQKPFALVLCS